MLYLSFLVLFIHVVGPDAKHTADQRPVERDEQSYKRVIPREDKNAFSNDFDACMFNRWKKDGVPILTTSPTSSCSSRKHFRLCYGPQRDRPDSATFISCYNNESLVPEFTAHVVPYTGVFVGKHAKRPEFVQDTGLFAPNPQAQPEDCSKPQGEGEYFCSKGHLTPNGAFDDDDKRSLTFIMTNVAPQWQPFNAGNWAVVEHAVKKYVDAVQHGVYVFTGTADKSNYRSTGLQWIPLDRNTKGIIAPLYFWKAVCDPVLQQSILFWAKNNVGEKPTDEVVWNTCLTKQKMTKTKGVVHCESVDEVRSRKWRNFLLPDFHRGICGTANRGEFLDKYLLNKFL